ITRTNGTLDIENNGLIVKSEGSGTTAFNYPYGGFHNLGSVRVEIGTLMLNNANSSFNASGDGDFEIVSGATLRFNQAEYDFDEGSAVSGEGTLLVTSGVVELGAGELSGPVHVSAGILRFIDTNTATELADVTISGGDLSGEAMKNINGLLTWTGGRLGFGGGVLNFRGGVSAEGDEDKVLGGGTYNNSSTFSWTGAGRLVVNRGGTFNNLEGAVFDIQNDVSLTRTNGILDFVNSGLIRKSAGSGATTIAHPFGVFNNDGEVRVESGTLYVRNQEESTDTGTWIVEEGARLHFNLHERTFTETASLIGTGALQISDGATILNHGTIAPGLSIGTLHIEGNLPASQPDGALEIELGGTEAGVDHDVLVASNIANLGGRLRLVLVDDFEPTGDEVFTIVQALAVVGEFDEVEAPEGFVAEVVYGAQEVTAQLLPVTTCSDGLQPDEHTLALYKFDEPLAGTSFDASDNQLHAIDDGTTVTEGRFCGARRFDGERDRIDIDVVRDALLGSHARTIEYIERSIDGGGVPERVNQSCGDGSWLGPRSNDVRFSIKTTAAGSCLWTVDEAFAEAAIDTL